MEFQRVDTPAIPPANSTYSQAFRMGDLIFVSGQLGADPATGKLADGIEAQTRQAIANMAAILEAAGSGLHRVAKANVYLADFSQLGAVNEIYGQMFPHRPAKTGVEVSALHGGALIEIEAVALAPEVR